MIDRTKAPVEGKISDFVLPKAEKFTLENGIDVLFIKKDNLPIVQAIVIVNAGSKLDPPGLYGLSYLTSLLIDEGAGELDALQLSAEIEKLGSVLNTTSDHDNVVISLMTLRENAARSFGILGSILSSPRLDVKDFEREKKKVLSRIIQLKNEPSYIAGQAFEHLVYGSAPYGFPEIGFEYTVGAIDSEMIKKFYSENYGSNNTTIILAGNLTDTEARDLCSKNFGEFKNRITISDTIPVPAAQKKKFFVINKDGSAQTELRIGHLSKPRNSEDYFAAKIMNAILGGQFSSRINLNLREKHGFTYGASSGFSHYKNSGYFVVSTSVKTGNTGDAVVEIFKELKGIKTEISEKEISFAKSYLLKQFPAKFETYAQIARNFSSLVVYSLPVNYYEDYRSSIEKISMEEIAAAAGEYVHPENTFVLAVGDAAEIKEQFGSLANGEITELDIDGNALK